MGSNSSKNKLADQGQMVVLNGTGGLGWCTVSKSAIVRSGFERGSSRVKRLEVGARCLVVDSKQGLALITKPIRGWIATACLKNDVGWAIARCNILVFGEPDKKGKILQHIQEGKKCFVSDAGYGWSRITKPIEGFIPQLHETGEPMLAQLPFYPGWHTIQMTMVKVRKDADLDSEEIKYIQEGGKVLIEEVKGTVAFIVQPVRGWISLYEQFGDIVVEPLNTAKNGKMNGRWHKVNHSCVMRETWDKQSKPIGTIPKDRIVHVLDTFMDRAKISKIAYNDENDHPKTALVSGWVPIITSNGDVVMEFVQDPNKELEAQAQYASPGRPKIDNDDNWKDWDPDEEPDEREDPYEREDPVEHVQLTPQGPDKDFEQEDDDEKQSEATTSIQFPPDAYLISFEKPYELSGVTQAVETAKKEEEQRTSRAADQYATSNRDRNRVEIGDQVLYRGRRGRVVDVGIWTASNTSDQVLCIQFPGETQTDFVSRNNVILDKSETPQTASGDNWLDMVEELGAVLHADVIRDRERFLVEWREVYGIDPSRSELADLLGRSLEITAIDFRHNTARSVVNNQVMWIPRSVLNEKGIPQFILDEDRVEGDDTPDGDPESPMEVRKQNEGEQSRRSSATKVPVTRMVHKITEADAKALILATSRNGKLHPSRLVYCNLTQEKLQDIAGKPAQPLAYDKRHDAYHILVDGEKIWVPAECTVVIPSELSMEPEPVKTVELVSIDPEIEGVEPTSPIGSNNKTFWEAEEKKEEDASEEKSEKYIPEPLNVDETPQVPEKQESLEIVEKQEHPQLAEKRESLQAAEKQSVIEIGLRPRKATPQSSKTSEGVYIAKQHEPKPLEGGRPPPSPLSKKDAIAEFSLRMHPAQLEGEEKDPPNTKMLVSPVKCVIIMNKSEIRRNRANVGLEPLPNRTLQAIQGKRAKSSKFNPDNGTYLVDTTEGNIWMPENAMMVLDKPKFVEESRLRQGEQTPPRIDSEGEPANVAVRKADQRKADPTLDFRRGRKLAPPVRAVVTMSRKLLESTWREAGGLQPDMLDTLKGQRVEVTEMEERTQMCKCSFRSETLWLPAGALMFLDKRKFADGGPPDNSENASKPKNINPYSNPIPVSPPTPVTKAPEVKHSSSKQPRTRPGRFEGRELRTPLNCVVTLNRNKLKTHLPKNDAESIERLKGTSVNATSIHEDSNGSWYRIIANGKNIWVPQDILLVKGNPDFRTAEPVKSAPNSVRTDKSFTEAFNARLDPGKTSPSNPFAPSPNPYSSVQTYTSHRKSSAPHDSRNLSTTDISYRKSSAPESPLHTSKPSSPVENTARSASPSIRLDPVTPERKKNTSYQSNHQPGAKAPNSFTAPPNLRNVEKRATTVQWVTDSLSILKLEWKDSRLPAVSEAKLRSILGAKVLGSDVERRRNIVKCNLNGETIWLPVRAVKFFNTTIRRG